MILFIAIFTLSVPIFHYIVFIWKYKWMSINHLFYKLTIETQMYDPVLMWTYNITLTIFLFFILFLLRKSPIWVLTMYLLILLALFFPFMDARRLFI